MASAQLIWAQKQEQLPDMGVITKEELAKHNTQNDCWVSFKGNVYNMTSYLSHHPGGVDIIMKYAGGDMTDTYMRIHKWVSPNLISKIKIGVLEPEPETKKETQ